MNIYITGSNIEKRINELKEYGHTVYSREKDTSDDSTNHKNMINNILNSNLLILIIDQIDDMHHVSTELGIALSAWLYSTVEKPNEIAIVTNLSVRNEFFQHPKITHCKTWEELCDKFKLNPVPKEKAKDPEYAFNMNDWKYYFSNNTRADAVNYLKERAADVCFFSGRYNDSLPALDFMQSNLIRGFFQNIEPKTLRNLFGVANLENNILTFVLMFPGAEMIAAFKESSLYESAEWSPLEYEAATAALFEPSEGVVQFFCK